MHANVRKGCKQPLFSNKVLELEKAAEYLTSQCNSTVMRLPVYQYFIMPLPFKSKAWIFFFKLCVTVKNQTKDQQIVKEESNAKLSQGWHIQTC